MRFKGMWLQTGLVAVGLCALAVQPARAVDVKDVVTRLKTIAKENSTSYEKLLAAAAPLAKESFDNVYWKTLDHNLQAAGLKPVDWNAGRFNQYRRQVQSDAVPIKPGLGMNFYLDFGVSYGRREPTMEVPPTLEVFQVGAGLVSSPLADVETIRRENWFGRSSLIQAALAEWPIREAQKEYPILETVDVNCRAVKDDDGKPTLLQWTLAFDLVKSRDDRKNAVHLKCNASHPQEPGGTHNKFGFWLSNTSWAPQSKLTLGDNLRKLLKQKPASYQTLLFQASHIVEKAIDGQEWSAVSDQLAAQGFESKVRAKIGYLSDQRFLVSKEAYKTAAGQSLDLYLDVNARRRTSDDQPTREYCDATAVLCGDVKMDYAQAISTDRFGKDSAVQHMLLDPGVKQRAEKLPMLGHVEIEYRPINDRWSSINHWGFAMKLDLAAAKESDGNFTQMGYIYSELDPPWVDGGTLLDKDFVSQDTLSEVHLNGGLGSGPRSIEPQKTFFLTKRGAPQWYKSDDDQTKPTIAYSVGDLKTLPADTRSIVVQNESIYDDDLAPIARFTQLQTLDLSHNEGISYVGLAHLVGLKKLQSLSLSGQRINTQAIKLLAQLPELKRLSIKSTKLLTAADIAEVAKLKQLTHLDLCLDDKLTDDGLGQLAGLSELKVLDIGYSEEITDVGLKQIARLKKLESLTFAGAKKVTDKGIAQLAELKNLRNLSVGNLPCGDDSLDAIVRLKSLEYLTLSDLKITDAGLPVLNQLEHLKRLSIYGCPAITEEGFAKLQSTLKGKYLLDP